MGSSHSSSLRQSAVQLPTEYTSYASEAQPTKGIQRATKRPKFLAKGKKPKLETRLCRSIVWFGEGCREQLDFLAIVKFVAALDTLAKGTKSKGICDLISNRLKIKNLDAPLFTDGSSARNVVEEIYNAGRSRIIHGSRPSLIEDFDVLRARAEYLATIGLRACISWLEGYRGPDNEDAFRQP